MSTALGFRRLLVVKELFLIVSLIFFFSFLKMIDSVLQHYEDQVFFLLISLRTTINLFFAFFQVFH